MGSFDIIQSMNVQFNKAWDELPLMVRLFCFLMPKRLAKVMFMEGGFELFELVTYEVEGRKHENKE